METTMHGKQSIIEKTITMESDTMAVSMTR